MHESNTPSALYRRDRRARIALACAALISAASVFSLTAGFGAGHAGEAQTHDSRMQDGQSQDAGAQRPARADMSDFGALLVAGLKQTEGCLGVDVANFQSGKNTIVAWFENKEAAVRWYNAPVHQRMMGAVGGGGDTPLKHVTDPDTPIMVMASISFNGPPAVEGSPLPFSQISIEMYAPLPGGASVNGRLAPDAFKVPHHKALGG